MAKGVRGANSGFLKDGVVHASDSSSCCRVALLRSRDIQPSHDAATLARFEIGHKNEDYFVDTILHGQDVQRDVEVVRGDFTGHVDIIVGDTVYELKSVTSLNVQKKVFDKGQYKLSNLAQLVGYMWASGKKAGILAYTFWSPIENGDADTYGTGHKAGNTRMFNVAVLDDGAIVVDGVVIDYTFGEWYAHHRLLVDTINRPGDARLPIPDYPINPQDTWNEPCKWTVCHGVCQTFNARTGTIDEFVELCKEVIK